jgi:hypothetical protein
VTGAAGRAAALAAGAALWGASAGCAGTVGPRLIAAMPAAAARGATVALTGAGLCGAQGDCAVAGGEIDFGRSLPMARAVVLAYTDTAAQIVVPDAAPVGDTAVIATVNEQASNALAFEVLP